MKILEGKVIKYEVKNLNTDLIIPARYLFNSEPDFLAEHCMEDLDPEFTKKVEKNNYTILAADSNFGCGSSREQAPIAIKAAGIKCVIAPSYARIFFRNAINIGLPIIEFNDFNLINTEDKVDIDFERGKLKNLTSNKEFEIKKMPPFLQELITKGGLVNFARNKILGNK